MQTNSVKTCSNSILIQTGHLIRRGGSLGLTAVSERKRKHRNLLSFLEKKVK